MTDPDLDLHEARRTVRQFWNWANLCYCGNPHHMIEVLRTALALHSAPGEKYEPLPPGTMDSPMALFVMYTLDAWKLTDHGGSVYGAWLTESGVRLREALLKVDPDTVFDEDWWDVEQVVNPNPDGLCEGEWVP